MEQVLEKVDLEQIRQATALGVQRAIADPQTWAAGFKAFREYAGVAAQREAGGYVVGWFKWLVGKVAVGLLFIIVLYLAGGLPAVLAFLKVKS